MESTGLDEEENLAIGSEQSGRSGKQVAVDRSWGRQRSFNLCNY